MPELRLVLAPMAGVTDPPFRRLCHIHGCDMAVTEMISAKALVYKNSHTMRMLFTYPDEGPVVVQLFGSEPEVMAEAAAMVADGPFAAIDINMGCPAPKIVKNGEGSALMKNPRLAGDIVRSVAGAVGLPVTVKIRKGWGNDDNAVEMAKIVEANGCTGITVHGRTREQYYSGQADWDVIRRVKESVKIHVTGNGDVFSQELAMRMIEETGCDSVMIGRGALGNPWIFDRERAATPNNKEKRAAAMAHFELLAEYKGEHIGILEMRKHLSWYVKATRDAANIKRRINAAASLDEMKSIIDEVFTDV